MAILSIDNLSKYVGATISGEDFTFQGQTIPKSTIQLHMDIAEDYLRMVLGAELVDSNLTEWDSTSSASQIGGQVKAACYDYVAYRVCVILAGGMVTGGWNYTLGELRKDRTEAWVQGFTALINGFRDSAKERIERLTPLSYSVESPPLDIGETSPSFY